MRKTADAKPDTCPSCGRPPAEAVDQAQSRKDTPRHPAEEIAKTCPCGYVWAVETRDLVE